MGWFGAYASSVCLAWHLFGLPLRRSLDRELIVRACLTPSRSPRKPTYDVPLLALMRPRPDAVPGALRRFQKRGKVRVVARFDEAAHGVAHLGAEGYR